MTEDDLDAKPKSRVWFRLCVTLGVIGGVIGLSSGLWLALREIVKPLAAQQQSRNNVKQIAIALHNINDVYGHMPGPFLDTAVEPKMTLPDIPADRLSWRVSILPYLESDPTYSRVNKSEAWNGPTNRSLLDRDWKVFADPEDHPTSLTPYRVFHDNGALWDSDPKRRLPLDRIPDGASNTILIAESTVQVPWAQFNEHQFDPNGSLPELGRASRNTFFLAMADGSVRVVKKSVAPNILRAAVTRDGGEQLPADW